MEAKEEVKEERTPIQMTTLNDVSQMTEYISSQVEAHGYTSNKFQDLFYYGNTGPVPLAHNHIRVIKNDTGLAVMATADIPKGVIVTHFPVHAIGWNHRIQVYEAEQNDETFMDKVAVKYAHTHSRYITLPLSRKNKEEKKEATEKGEENGEENEDDTPAGIVLIGNPNNTRDTLLLGHVIRDAVGNPFMGVPLEEIRTWLTFKNKVAVYNIKGSSLRNCRYVLNKSRTIMSVETTRPIKEGEELRTLYGAEHWFHRAYDKKDTKMIGNYLFELLAEDTEFYEWLTNLYKS